MDADVPVLKEKNCFTKKDFLELLDFDAHIFQMSPTMKFIAPTDEQVLKWAIHTLMTRGWHISHSPQYVFIITRDKKFKTTSSFSEVMKHHVKENRRDLILIESLDSEEGDHKKRELFSVII